jgi:hypothetical protein
MRYRYPVGYLISKKPDPRPDIREVECGIRPDTGYQKSRIIRPDIPCIPNNSNIFTEYKEVNVRR